VLAGRNQGRLSALAERLSQDNDGIRLETAVAGSEGPGPLRELIGPGDVLVSTAGPFLKIGRPAVEAAADAGAVYLDSSGEPPFIRQVFEEFGPRAERTGAVLLTAMGYDYVPGNLAGALALDAAGPAAARVKVGYFVRGNLAKAASAGTRASVAGVLLEPGYSLHGGRIATERSAARVTSFEVDGSRRPGLSIGSSEHFALPRLRQQSPLTEVGVYLGWFGSATGLVHRASAFAAPMERIPSVRKFLDQQLRRRGRGGRCRWQAPRDGAPHWPGPVLLHRAPACLGGDHSGRPGRAARRRARPGRGIRTGQPRKSLRRGRISSSARQDGCLTDATIAGSNRGAARRRR
jgi:hypothetical protein